MKAYIDASIVIHALDVDSDVFSKVRTSLSAEWLEPCISDLVRMECLVHPLRNRDLASEFAVRTFCSNVTTLTMTPDVYDLAAQYRADLGLKTPDALHLATAVRHGCDEFWTNDERLRRAPVSIVFHSFA